MNERSRRRIERLEATQTDAFSGIEFFHREGDLLRHAATGKLYTDDEMLRLAEQNPRGVFIPVAAPRISPVEEVECEAWWMEAVSVMLAEHGRVAVDTTSDPRVLDVLVRQEAFEREEMEREELGRPFWNEQLRRMGRVDLLAVADYAD